MRIALSIIEVSLTRFTLLETAAKYLVSSLLIPLSYPTEALHRMCGRFGVFQLLLHSQRLRGTC